MDTGRVVVCAFVAVLLTVSPVAASGAATSVADTTPADTGPVTTAPADTAPASGTAASVTTPDRLAAAQSVDPDTVLLRADVAADGTAHWRIEYLVRLDDQNATDAFESVAADIRNDSSRFTDRFAERMRRTAGSAENATGREMAIRNVTVETARQDLGAEYGVVRYEFTWTNFAAANETTLRIGDALGGFFLDSETQLTVAWPAGYNVVSVSPPAAEQSATNVIWQGRQSFPAAGPRVVVSTTAPTTTNDGGGGPDGSATSGSTLLIVSIVAAIVALAVAWYVTQRRGEDGPAPTASGDGAGPTATEEPSDGDSSESDAEGEEDVESEPTATDAAADEGPPEELLSNEERVLRLLEDRGGRIKQQEIAGELDWTDAKTSQVVTGLREDDEVEVFRLGRENVVTLPDEDGL